MILHTRFQDTCKIRRFLRLTPVIGLLLGGACSQPEQDLGEINLDRTVLPIQEPVYEPITELDARNAVAPPPFSVKPPEGATNVVIVLIDDIGFGAAAGFGGAIQTPTLDRLAAEGLRFNQFHATALCSPTRMSTGTLDPYAPSE